MYIGLYLHVSRVCGHRKEVVSFMHPTVMMFPVCAGIEMNRGEVNMEYSMFPVCAGIETV